MFRYEVNIAPGAQKHLSVPIRLLPPGRNHAITMRHIQEDQVTKLYPSASVGLASRRFTNFFSQDLLSKLHPLGGGAHRASLGGAMLNL